MPAPPAPRASTFPAPSGQHEAGFTLLELVVAMSISGVMLALSVTGWQRYQRASEVRQSTDQVVSVLRNAQEAAFAEATTYCVRFGTAPATYEVVRPTCAATATAVIPVTNFSGSRIRIVSPSFTQEDGSVTSAVQFTPRGSATRGSLQIGRTDLTGRLYKISVEGLTARVSVS